MNKPASAVIGGGVAAAVLSVILLVVDVETRSQIGIFEVVARFVGMPGSLVFGFVLFFAAGTFLWPLVFVALESYLPIGPDPAIRGMGFGVPLWVAFVVLGRGDLTGAILVVYAVLTLFAHLVYGFVLGAVYGHYSGETAARMEPFPGEKRAGESGGSGGSR
ncbi:DUF6789 family protein [Candidatus Halobonum tyrrellensis]|uniref:Uncharacterized protein n=1 Tax=Candidatus Halobonum tyrrellensis G22 TaxID=1324957 RepID=V4HFV0_9EURY|nr:DUF6789 family protein [Candidatus Halobonum tyrrellensis]ESP88978.1 hypothetical protein K933_05998 [Candidatus Halobonum tyrrellensis G22]